LLQTAPSASGKIPSSQLSPRIANYTIAVVLDTSDKTISGREKLTWQNTSPDTIPDLQFHLYLNAFKSNRTTFMQESGGRHRGYAHRTDSPGWITINSMETADGLHLTPHIEFIRPDDGNEDDSTVCRVPLPQPLPPGETVTLLIDFTAKLPPVSARTGYHGDFFMAGQWFPKIGVYESPDQREDSAGGWNCHQFHDNTEFYADFGVYDVMITVPDGYIVGATGARKSLHQNTNGTQTLTYYAEDVHDFAWTASPHFVEVNDRWRHVNIRVLMQASHADQVHRYLDPARSALQYLADHIAVYPYSQLTIVDPPFQGGGAGGMEYPTLITTGTIWGIGSWTRWPERVTVHEFAHQYWYGIVANNEFEEEWLDEGLTEYFECRIMDDTYGKRSSSYELFGLGSGTLEQARNRYTGMPDPTFAPIVTPTWKLQDRRVGLLTYYKSATVLATLERLIGRAAMDSALRVYFHRWKFRHPYTPDFVAVFNEIVPALHGTRFGQNLNWYFDQFLFGTTTCDFELSTLSSTPAHDLDSLVRSDSPPDTENSQEQMLYESTVTVRQLRDARLPVDIKIVFQSGDEVTEHWDGRSPEITYTYREATRIEWAEVDPERKILLDMNFVNNSKTCSPPGLPVQKYTAKIFYLLQNILLSLLVFS
jgi:hypothetical protein